MNNRDILGLCVGNLLRRKTRTILAVIGVIVGVCAIVVMVSIGVALDVGFQQQVEGFGNLHSIEVYNWGGGGGTSGERQVLDDTTIKKLGKLDGVTAITPQINAYLYIGIGHMKAETSVYGVEPEYLEKMNYDLDHGRSMNAGDRDSNVILFGRNIANWFYDPKKQDYYDWSNTEPTCEVVSKDVVITANYNYGTNHQPGPDEIKYEEFKAEGIGLLASESDETAYCAYMPINALQKIIDANTKAEGGRPSTGKKTYNQVMIYADDIDKVADICATIKEDYGFQTYSLQDMLKELQQTAKMIEMVLGGIGAVSLLVAAIGIANTMIMSVYERTREISVMKVIGASLRDIKKMFLLEAGLIGFGGGIIGVGLSYLMSWAANNFLSGSLGDLIGTGGGTAVSVIPIWLSLGALLFATAVGIVSGWLPANRAMKLSVLEGLKNE